MNGISFNINLLIPFKDNKGDRLKVVCSDVERFRKELDDRVDRLKNDIDAKITGSELTIAARSDGNSEKYYWRFKNSSRDRKYNRLHAEPVIEYLGVLNYDISAWLVEVEEELIYINANLKLVKGILDAIDQVSEEKKDLFNVNLHNLPVPESS